jgi:hypothetical protein
MYLVYIISLMVNILVNDDGEGKPHILSVLDLLLNLFDCEIYCF